MKPTDPIVKKYLRKNANDYNCKDTRNVRCCNHSTSTGNYISFVGRDLDAAKSIGQKLFVELNNNFKSLTEKASSKDNYNATFKELNP